MQLLLWIANGTWTTNRSKIWWVSETTERTLGENLAPASALFLVISNLGLSSLNGKMKRLGR